jgi:hypothetical protein
MHPAAQHCLVGPVILTNLFKTAMLHVVLDWQKIFKNVSDKAFSLFCGVSIIFLVLFRKNLENGPFER